MELVSGSPGRGEFQLECITCILHERNQLSYTLNKAKHSTREAEQELHNMNFEKRAFVATVEVQNGDIRPLNMEKESIHKLLVDREASSCTDRNRRRTGVIYSALRLHHVGMASKRLKSVRRCSAREKAELCSFEVA